MSLGIILTDIKHLLECMETWGKKKIIIRIPEYSKEVSINPTSKLTSSQNLKQVIHVDAIENSTENCALAYTISYGEEVREESIPSNICRLVSIDEYQ